MDELEGESAAHARARAVRRVRRVAIEFLFAFGFIAPVFVAGRAAPEGGGVTALSVAALVFAVAVLAAWCYFYVRWHLSHDEFERALEAKAVALAGGITILGATSIGFAELLFGGPIVQIVFIAPAFSVVYAIARFAISRSYR